jgi:hypothetical protein
MNPLLRRIRHGGMVGAGLQTGQLHLQADGPQSNQPGQLGGPPQLLTFGTILNTNTGTPAATVPTSAITPTKPAYTSPSALATTPASSPLTLTTPEKIGLGVAVLAAVLYFSGALK